MRLADAPISARLPVSRSGAARARGGAIVLTDWSGHDKSPGLPGLSEERETGLEPATFSLEG
jgi:hypothetical protein